MDADAADTSTPYRPYCVNEVLRLTRARALWVDKRALRPLRPHRSVTELV
jgi:hypothetical protein